MTKLKDKLSANVRMARASQQSADEATSVQTASSTASPSKRGAAPPAEESKPAAGPPTAKPASPRQRTTAVSAKEPGKESYARPTTAGEIPESGSELFPARVWPD